MLKILVTVFKEPHSLLLASMITWLVFTGAVWLPDFGLVTTVLASSASVTEKFSFLFTLYQSISTNFTVVSATYTILIAFLFGLQVTLLLYYIRTRKTSKISLSQVSGTGIGGLIAGIFGIGCAACGTFILTAVLSLVGAGGLLTFLPFGGEEFGFIGVGLLVYSIYLLLKKIEEPKVCLS